MNYVFKKRKNILLGILFIAIIVCTPFMFGDEGCDDGFHEVANSVDQNIQNDANNSNVKDPYGLNLTADDMRGLLQLQKTHRITEAQAKEVALQSARELDKNSNARTARSISKVSTIYYSNGEKTTNARVTETDPSAFPLYVVNFANDEGFTIVGGDERLSDPVLFEAEKGTYNGETSDNKEFEFVTKLIPAYIGKEIEKENRIRDSLLVIAIEKINEKLPDDLDITLPSKPNGRVNTPCPPYCGGGNNGGYGGGNTYSSITNDVTSTTVSLVGPLINLLWGQGAPYNNQLDILPICNSRPPTGCTATAEAMLAAYWERPTTYNWASMKTNQYAHNLSATGQAEVARLMRNVGIAEGMDYQCNVSGAWPYLNFFIQSNSYNIPRNNNGSVFHAYSQSVVRGSLNYGRPIIIVGWEVSNSNIGHTWLLDGYRRNTSVRSYTFTLYSSSGSVIHTQNVTSTLSEVTKIHCNWGWDGSNNGYITNAVFDTTVSFYDPNGTNSRTNSNFSYSLTITPNIYRN